MSTSRRRPQLFRLHRSRLCPALAIVLVLTNQAAAYAPPANTGINPEDANNNGVGARLLDAAPIAALNADLHTDGYRITPMVLGSGGETRGIRVSLLGVESTQPHPEIAMRHNAWDSAVPITVAAVSGDAGILATVETRLRTGERGGVEFIHEVRPAAASDVRVRVTDALNQGTNSRSVQIMGRQANGTFAEVFKDGQGQSHFANGELFARGGFSDCVDNCFDQINNPISWAELLCMAATLLAGGIAAAATGGAGIVPIVSTGLDICGLMFLIANAAGLAGCIIQCV